MYEVWIWIVELIQSLDIEVSIYFVLILTFKLLYILIFGV